MDESLASALDKVLILSGGDPDKAVEALNARFAAHMGWKSTSTTTSTVSSPTTTTSFGGFPLPERIVRTCAEVRSPSVQVLSSPRQPRTPAHRSTLEATSMTPGSRIAPVPPPLLTSKSPSEPMIHVRCPPSAWVEVPSDSDDEAVACVQPLTYGHNSPRPVGNPAGLTAKLTAEVNVLRDLPPLLTHITLEESALSPDDFRLFKDAILADPFYLGEPRHIRLRNSKGSVTKRVMSTPTPGAPTPERWYAVACGTEVGIFLSWIIAGDFVTGKKGNLHKSFNVESDAYIWLQVALLRGSVELLN